MELTLTFDNVFKIPINSLKLTRSHPEIPKDAKWFFPFIFVHGIYMTLFLILMYNIIGFNIKEGDFIRTCKNGTFCVMILSVTFQYIILVWKQKCLSRLIEKVKDDYVKVRELSSDEQKIVLKYAEQSMWVGQMWFWEAIIGIAIFPIKNFALHIYYYCINDFRWIHTRIYDMNYPFGINEIKDHKIIFFSLYFVMIFYSAYGATIYCSFSPLGPNFMLHACAQLEILTKRIENLFYDKDSLEDIINELKSVATELQRIHTFVDDIIEAFRVGFEVILKVTSILLPITVYEIVEAFKNNEISVEFCVFMAGSIIISTSPCYYSELLMEKGNLFRLAIYSCSWERTWDVQTRTMILLLLQRASRPIAISTIFKILCLDTLTDVYRQSYAIFSLMNAMWD